VASGSSSLLAPVHCAVPDQQLTIAEVVCAANARSDVYWTASILTACKHSCAATLLLSLLLDSAAQGPIVLQTSSQGSADAERIHCCCYQATRAGQLMTHMAHAVLSQVPASCYTFLLVSKAQHENSAHCKILLLWHCCCASSVPIRPCCRSIL